MLILITGGLVKSAGTGAYTHNRQISKSAGTGIPNTQKCRMKNFFCDKKFKYSIT